ncbi:alanine dehydrogenase [Halolactibacillus miurensis]|uniref:Alanine dehydrogenase n=1 Tax=Halolactibacillus miurensis TaxID=306541 RepID=A0A1I6P836_9BACI|nr:MULTISPECIES: alanine dehydrogenase [Halolactibacillus]GEM03060.1 alanine dehydrogenase [Halolactibacillus miurensis]SFS36349.1 alanine dehydrogenase [Halolactibacillus miurensis]
MRIGIPKEIKNNEFRVAMTPVGVELLTKQGHEVFIETTAGEGAGFLDEDYQSKGAVIVPEARDAWEAEMVIKVKEPLASEYRYFRDDLILFTYLHLANEPKLTEALKEAKTTAIAYETMVGADGGLPMLHPMSVIAGRLSVQVAAHYLQKPMGGSGALIGGVPGVKNGKVTIIGGGVSGQNALQIAKGLGAHVTLLDIRAEVLTQVEADYGHEVVTQISNEVNIREAIKDADIVVGAVLIPGRKAPKLVSEDMVKQMKPGSVIVDIAVDQGGIFETADLVTTHDDPVYERHGVLHYAVANMPGAVPRTSTIALTNVTLPHAVQLANRGVKKAAERDHTLYSGINLYDGKLTNLAVAETFGYEYHEFSQLVNDES